MYLIKPGPEFLFNFNLNNYIWLEATKLDTADVKYTQVPQFHIYVPLPLPTPAPSHQNEILKIKNTCFMSTKPFWFSLNKIMTFPCENEIGKKKEWKELINITKALTSIFTEGTHVR